MRHAFLPEGEHVRRAIQWISDHRRDEDHASSLSLVNQASIEFDLSPLEEAWLIYTFVERREVN
jgi:hypothetical protein